MYKPFLIFTVSFILHATCMQFISTGIHAQEMKVKVDVLKQNILVHVYSVLVAKWQFILCFSGWSKKYKTVDRWQTAKGYTSDPRLKKLRVHCHICHPPPKKNKSIAATPALLAVNFTIRTGHYVIEDFLRLKHFNYLATLAKGPWI